MYKNKLEKAEYLVQAHGRKYSHRNLEIAKSSGFRSWSDVLQYADRQSEIQNNFKKVINAQSY